MPNSCGPAHIVVGDGGNNEGVSRTYFDTVAANKKFCAPGNETLRGFPVYGGNQACFSLNPNTGLYCDFTQPIW